MAKAVVEKRQRTRAETWPAWEVAPHEQAAELGRGQLLLILAAVGVVLVPHVGGLPAWVFAGALLAAGWRYGAVLGWWQMPGTIARTVLTFSAVFAVTAYFKRISGLEAGSALLITMMALKLLETRNRRDRSVVILIAWFVLFTGFLREQSLSSVPQLAAGLLIGLLALLQGMRLGPLLPARPTLSIGTKLVGQAVPLAVVLFLLFPRLPGPFWATPAPGSSGRTGLTDQMGPGDITSLAQSDEVAFRVRFEGLPPEPAELYWRGPVLDQFDGRRWRAAQASERRRAAPPYPGRKGRIVAFEMILEPHADRWLVPLDTPLDWDLQSAGLSAAAELLSEQPIDRRLAYRGRSSLAGLFVPATAPTEQQLSLPPKRNPRTAEFARELKAGSASDADFVQRVLAHFRSENFFYTLQPPPLGAETVDDFLFGTRAGFCEHYASAFAVMARSAGIPARIVAGYQGGERNPIGDYWIVRQSDAHAWVEVWLDDRWVRVDPTGAVAPERIESGLDAAIPSLADTRIPLLGSSAFLARAALSWDAVNATWDRWVLAFGPDRQARLLEGLGIQAPTLRDIALVCAATVGALLLGFTVLSLRTARPALDPVEQVWAELCRRLASVTRPRHAAEGPSEYAAAVAALRPDLAATVSALARTYLRLRYEGIAGAKELARFRQQVAGFRPANPPGGVNRPPAPAPG